MALTLEEQVALDAQTCRYRDRHVAGEPQGYNAWHRWASRMARTHRQSRCRGCGLYLIWTAR